jgi:uncharacterized membrane protein YhaH (DUF805 family)
MFKNPFSFAGRIRRLEYGISYLIHIVLFTLGALFFDTIDKGEYLFFFLLIILKWFIFAQGAKRSHDIGNSGFLQLIPFYIIMLIFAEGTVGSNKYGLNPKEFPFQGYKKESFQINLPENKTFIGILNQLVTLVLLNTLIISLCIYYLKQHETLLYVLSLISIIGCCFLALSAINYKDYFSQARLYLNAQRVAYSLLLYLGVRLFGVVFLLHKFDIDLLFYEGFYIIIILVTTYISYLLYSTFLKKNRND